MDKQIMPISASDFLFVLFLDLLVVYRLCARCSAILVSLGPPSLHLFGIFFFIREGQRCFVTGIGGFKLHQLAT